jgi:hypothetical protein
MFGKEASSGLLATALSGGLLSLLVLPGDPAPAVGKTSYLPVDLTEPFPSMRDRLTADKAGKMARQRALLTARYDLADRPAPGVTMSRGKPVQAGVRVKQPPGASWEQLAGLEPAVIRERDLFAQGFLPLPQQQFNATEDRRSQRPTTGWPASTAMPTATPTAPRA